MQSMEETIKGILVRSLGVKPDMVCAEARLREDLRADSLDIVEFVSALSTRYKVKIDDMSVRDIQTFGQITEYVRNNSINS